MQVKLKEMLLVLRPTEKGSGKIPLKELEQLLRDLGYDFLVTPELLPQIKTALDKEGTGVFNEDDLISHLVKNYSMKYSNARDLREALMLFDFDNDGKINCEEFEYFMRNFGIPDNETHMSEQRLQTMFETCKEPSGQVDIEKVVLALVEGWQ